MKITSKSGDAVAVAECMISKLLFLAGAALFASVISAPAQDPGTLHPTPPPLANPDSPKTLAKELFARIRSRLWLELALLDDENTDG